MTRERSLEKGTLPGEHRERRSTKSSGGLLELLIILLVAFALVFGFVKPFVVQSFWIPSESMVPTLEVGDRVFVNKFVYRFFEPERGDIVVFQSPDGDGEELIKRVVGLPGDHIALHDGQVFVNFGELEEPYVQEVYADEKFSGNFLGATRVPEGKVFVMGDNRGNSRDSRSFGPVPIESLDGEAFVIFWPLTRIGLI